MPSGGRLKQIFHASWRASERSRPPQNVRPTAADWSTWTRGASWIDSDPGNRRGTRRRSLHTASLRAALVPRIDPRPENPCHGVASRDIPAIKRSSPGQKCPSASSSQRGLCPRERKSAEKKRHDSGAENTRDDRMKTAGFSVHVPESNVGRPAVRRDTFAPTEQRKAVTRGAAHTPRPQMPEAQEFDEFAD